MIAAMRGLGDSPLFVFAGGGTGGHLYPALAIAEALRDRLPSVRLCFLVTDRAIDRKVFEDAGHETIAQPVRSVGMAPWRWPRAYRKFRFACGLCRTRFEHDCPAVVVGTGGLSSVPAICEANRLRIPTAILNPDAIPGRANRYLAQSVHAVFVQWADATAGFLDADRVFVTGCPTRGVFSGDAAALRRAGIARFGLDANRLTLLVTGASQGSRNLNRSIVANLDLITAREGWQVLHLTGDSDLAEVRSAYQGYPERHLVLGYTHHMAEALAVADLVIARAGASFLAELTALGRASLLLPYPYHRDRHQLANARCLERHGAALIVADRIDLRRTAPAVRAALETLLDDEMSRRKMAAAARSIGQPNAAALVAEHLHRLASMGAVPTLRESLQAS